LHRGNQGRVTADEHFVADGGRIFREAIVVASDGAGANIRLVADLRVAKIRKVHGFRAFAYNTLFQFHKITDARPALQMRLHTHAREGADHNIRIQPALADDAVRFNGDLIAKHRLVNHAAGFDHRTRADFRLAEKLDAWLKNGIFAHHDVRIDHHGLR